MSCMILVGKDAFKRKYFENIIYDMVYKIRNFNKKLHWVKNGFFQSTFDVSGITSGITCDGRMV